MKRYSMQISFDASHMEDARRFALKVHETAAAMGMARNVMRQTAKEMDDLSWIGHKRKEANDD